VERQSLTPIRILIADDYEAWRRQVRSLFQARPEWHVIAEAVDGAEAVQKAEALKPDLIVLDIGLPRLNGIEVAQQIRQLSPSSKIIFLSQYNSLDVVEAALSTGALGYVWKTDAQRALLLAAEGALRGVRSVSSSIKGYQFTEISEESAHHRHEILLYSDDEVLLDRFTPFVAASLHAGKAAIVLVTKAHEDVLLQRLRAGGVDTDGALQQGTLIFLDIAKTLSRFMVNDMPDAARFFEVAGGVIEAARKAAKNSRVVACGECSPHLLAEGKPEATIQLERLWDELATTFEMDTLCVYALSSFHGNENENVFQRICAEHSAVYSQ
jgi:DNA-binding NarL/FixJ family response regulator